MNDGQSHRKFRRWRHRRESTIGDAHRQRDSLDRFAGSGQLLERLHTFRFDAFAKFVEIVEAVDPRIVAVAPDERERVIAHSTDVPQLEIAARLVFNRARMPLARGTRAVPAQDLVGDGRLRAIGPLDFENRRPMWGLDLFRTGTTFGRHAREPKGNLSD